MIRITNSNFIYKRNMSRIVAIFIKNSSFSYSINRSSFFLFIVFCILIRFIPFLVIVVRYCRREEKKTE